MKRHFGEAFKDVFIFHFLGVYVSQTFSLCNSDERQREREIECGCSDAWNLVMT